MTTVTWFGLGMLTGSLLAVVWVLLQPIHKDHAMKAENRQLRHLLHQAHLELIEAEDEAYRDRDD